jgi:hypothetical protein
MISSATGEYRFVVSAPGNSPLLVQRAQEAVAVATQERAEWVAWAEYFRTERGGITYEIPRVKPHIRGLTSDQEGRIWVDVFVPAEKRNEPPRPEGDRRPLLTWKERTTYDVFAPRGAYLGRIELPAESTLSSIRTNLLYLRTRGPDGEDRISVYRIVPQDGS